MDHRSPGGMVQFDTIKNDIVNFVQYESIKPWRHCCCKYKDKIYIIDGENAEISTFDPAFGALNKFTKKIDLSVAVGKYPSVVVVLEKIYILHGHNNKKYYFIYDPITNTIADHTQVMENLSVVAVLEYNQQILKFGGYRIQEGENIDTFMISSRITRDKDILEWTEKAQWKLPKTLTNPGHILYGHYIVILGGCIWTNKNNVTFSDEIYVLDLQKDEGWRKVKDIKCPVASEYLAAVGADNRIHLLTGINVWPLWRKSEIGHYSIALSTVLGAEFINNGN